MRKKKPIQVVAVEEKTFFTSWVAIVTFSLSILSMGVVLTAYAHTNFATKKEVDSVVSILNRIDERMYILVKEKLPDPREKK